VREIGRQLAEALAYAHAQGVVHRDVKPSNVLLCEDDRVLLADFGIARLVGEAEHYTKSGETIGSPAYLAPEQVAAEPIGPEADVYSLGLVLLEALTGVRAYGGSPVEAAVARLHAGPAVPTHLDAGWRSLIVRMTQRDPAFRPSAAEVSVELTEASWSDLHERAAVDTGQLERTGEQPAVEDPGHRARSRHRFAPSERRAWAAWFLGLLIVAALVAVVLVAPWNRPQKVDSDPVIPSGVPTRLQEPLADLHDAVEGHRP
jgi:serine/threonine protein kinase